MNYYELLEVTPNASTEVIKNAYKTLAKKFHPDTYSGDRTFAEEKMKLLNEAIEVLGNEEKRKTYNEENSIGIYSNMSTVFSSSDTDAFIEEIDNFLNIKTKKSSNNSKESSSKANKSNKINIDDIEISGETEEENINIEYADDSEDDGYDMDDTDDINDIRKNISTIQMRHSEDSVRNLMRDEYDSEIEETVKKSRRRSKQKAKPKVGKWYYITLGVVIALNILFVFLITRTLNFDNIRNLISGKGSELSDAGNMGDENDFDADYDLESMGEDIDNISADEIATEPTIESDYALGIPDGIPIARSNDDETTEQNITLPPQTQPPTQPPTTKAAVKTPVPATQKPTAAPPPATTAAVVETTVEPTTEAVIIDVTTEETTEEDTAAEQFNPVENETQESLTDEQVTVETPDNTPETTASEIEATEPETAPPPQEQNTEPVTEPVAPVENQNIEDEIDIAEH